MKRVIDLDKGVIELREVFDVLGQDILTSRNMVKENDSPFWRRTLVRSLFACIEGMSYRMKYVALIMARNHSVRLSPAERALMKEESYDLNDKGEAAISKSKLRTADNLLFSLKIAARACKTPFEIDKGGEGWGSFKDALKIRDRITHPKNSQDLLISDEELNIVWKTINWYVDSMTHVLVISAKSLEKLME
jgi:hypothetical protein